MGFYNNNGRGKPAKPPRLRGRAEAQRVLEELRQRKREDAEYLAAAAKAKYEDDERWSDYKRRKQEARTPPTQPFKRRPLRSNKDRTEITGDEVIALLRSIERHRCAIAADQAIFAMWLDGAPTLAKVWREFNAAGGVTADDFYKFMHGKFNRRRVRQRKHLRLVSSREPLPIRRRLTSKAK